jgi:MFS family permease
VVWYSGQFWALYFLQQVSKLNALTTAYIVGAGLIIGTPTLIFFGWLSDHIGRKPVILGGLLLAAVTYYPLYTWLGSVTQPGNVNYPIAIIIVAILVAYVGMVYGPIGAFLAEYFPGRIRYTSVSVPYHIGNGWGGGLVPFITTAVYQATGSLGYALIYPIAVPAGRFRAQPIPDAGNAAEQHLGGGSRSKGVTRNPASLACCGRVGCLQHRGYTYPTLVLRLSTTRLMLDPRSSV